VAASNSFGTFLETRELLRKPQEKNAPSEPDDPAVAAAVRLLEHPLPAPVHELLQQTRLPLACFYDAIQMLRDEGLIEMRAGDEGELLDLTDRGHELVSR